MREGRFKIQDKDVFVWGANADIIEWALRSEFAREFLLPERNLDALLAALSFGPHWGFSAIEAYKLLLTYWGKDIGLGPYPLPDVLAHMEHRGAYYADYREHVVHQLIVFLVGMMVYDTCPKLREAVDMEIRQDGVDADEISTEFVRRWKVASLSHDVGYVLETRATDPNFPPVESDNPINWDWLMGKLTAQLKAPLSHTQQFSSHGLTTPLEESATKRHLSDITAPQQLEESMASLSGSSDYLESLSKRCGLGTIGAGKSILLRYYDLHQKVESKGRPRFRDHGITSAMLLLTTWSGYRYYVEQHQDGPHALLGSFRLQLDSAGAAIQQMVGRKTLLAAAGAIALHNVDMSLLKEEQYTRESLTPSKFRLRLTGDSADGDLGPTPLAFLLVLTDTLQDWGRQVFRAPRGSDQLLASADVGLRPFEGKLRLFYRRDSRDWAEPWRTNQSCFARTLQRMKAHLQETAVDDLFEWDSARSCESVAWDPHSNSLSVSPGSPTDSESGSVSGFIQAIIDRRGIRPREVRKALNGARDALQFMNQLRTQCGEDLASRELEVCYRRAQSEIEIEFGPFRDRYLQR